MNPRLPVRHVPVILLATAALAVEDAPLDAEAEGNAEASTPTVEEILARPLEDGDYREDRTCLWRRAIDGIEIVDESLIVFEGRVRGRYWVNRLSQPCVGLRRNMVVTTRSSGGSVCRLDAIDARPRGASPFEPPVRCHLGGFEAIDELQVEALKRAVDERAKSRRTSDER